MRLTESGYTIEEIIVKEDLVRKRARVFSARKLARRVGAQVSNLQTSRLTADVVWFSVPDAEITKAAAGFSQRDWRCKLAFHSSGVLTSDALAPLKKRGAKLASVHPLMTFVAGSIPDLGGVTFAIEGDVAATRAACEIVRDLGGDAMRLRKKHKSAYHAFATIICPHLVSLLAASEEVALQAGMSKRESRRRMMPIIRQTLENYLQLGPAAAFSGPIVRGDVETIRLHLRTLSKIPEAKNVYAGLARAALEYLPARRKRELRKLLEAD